MALAQKPPRNYIGIRLGRCYSPTRSLSVNLEVKEWYTYLSDKNHIHQPLSFQYTLADCITPNYINQICLINKCEIARATLSSVSKERKKKSLINCQ